MIKRNKSFLKFKDKPEEVKDMKDLSTKFELL